jgi:hypothetical protein
MKNQELGNLLSNAFQFSAGLNKSSFRWARLDPRVTVLTGTDTTGIVVWCNTKYYVQKTAQGVELEILR